MNIFIELLFALGFFFLTAAFLGSRKMVYVAVILPFADRSGKTTILGVYRRKEKAEAKIYRYNQTAGYETPSKVVACLINRDVDLDEQEPPPKGVLPIK